jgi:hypothetical protein
MSKSETDAAAQARALAADLSAAVDGGRLDILSDDDLGRLLASAVRLFAEKAQMDGAGPPFGGNIGVTATDVMIAATAMLDAVDVEVFELTLWQNLTSIKPKDNGPAAGSEDYPR